MASYTLQHSLDLIKLFFLKKNKLGGCTSASGDCWSCGVLPHHPLCVSFLSSTWVLAVPLPLFMSLITSHFFSRGQNLQFQLPLEDSAGEVKTLKMLFGDGGGKFTCDFNETGKQCFLQI